MDSGSAILVIGVIGVTILLLAILYFLYKCLMHETPYQKTHLIEEMDAKHSLSDKKGSKKLKVSSTVRQRGIAKTTGEMGDKVLSKKNNEEVVVPLVPVVLAAEPKLPVSGDAGVNARSPKKKAKVEEKVEKVQQQTVASSKAAVGQKVDEGQTSETDSKPMASSAKLAPPTKDDKTKAKSASALPLEPVQQMEKKEEKKTKPVKESKEKSDEAQKDVAQQQAAQQQQQQADKKKKGKKSNEGSLEAAALEVKVKQEVFQLPPASQAEEIIHEQRVKVAPTAAAPQQQQQSFGVATKKKGSKSAVKVSDDFEAVVETVAVQTESKQQRSAPLPAGQAAVEHKAAADTRQQHVVKVVAASSQGEVDVLRKLLEEKEALIKRDQIQMKSLNESIFQMKKEMAGERNRHAELENNMHSITKKHAEEKQSMLNTMHQKDQQSKQSMQLLQQDLQTSQQNLSMISAKLAEENAKLKAEIGSSNMKEKHLAEELLQKSKTVELLNESLKNTQIALGRLEMTNESLEVKVKQIEDRSRSLEMKQKEMSRLEQLYRDSQQELQHVKVQQSQSNVELQNQLMTAKAEHDETLKLSEKLKAELAELKKDVEVAKTAQQPIVKETAVEHQQLQASTQISNGYGDTAFISQLEAKLAEREVDGKALAEKLEVVELEKCELFSLVEMLKKKAEDLEKELEDIKSIPVVEEPIVASHAEPTQSSVSNGSADAELVERHVARLAELEDEMKSLVEKLEAKDKKNEDLRQKNWKTVEALTESEKKREVLERDRDCRVKQLNDEITKLKLKATEAEHKKSVDASEKATIQKVIGTTDASTQSVSGREGDRVKVGKPSADGEDPEIENVKQLKLVAKTNQICIEGQEEEIRRLGDELVEQKNKNDELRKKNWTIMSSLNETEKKLEEFRLKLEQSETELLRLKTPTVTQTIAPPSSPAKDEECHVVTKEYTVVNKVKETCQWDMSQLVLDLDTKTAEIEILQSLLDQHEDAITELNTENKALKERLSSSSSQPPSTSSNEPVVDTCNQNEVSSLKSQLQVADKTCDGLVHQVEHYKKVLSETENILIALEAKSESEEAGWKNRIENLEREVTVLRSKNTEEN